MPGPMTAPLPQQTIEARLAGGLAALAAALRFLTRLPVPRLGPADDPDAPPPLAATLWAMPAAGALVGSVGAATILLATALGLPPLVGAGLAVSVLLALTGALHEDGFADVADALGGATIERRLAILRDSRIGTFGAAALVMLLLLRTAALAALAADGGWLAAAALVAAGGLARAAALAPATMLPPARPDGLGHGLGRLPRRGLWTAAATAAAIALAVLAAAGATGAWLAAILAAAAAAAVVVRLAARRFGGHTGDVAGAAAAAAETAVVLALAAVAGAAA